MSNAFGDHVLSIPYRPVADLFAQYRDRDPVKPAIIDVESGSVITFGQLDRVTAEIAALLKTRGVTNGSRVLLLAEDNLEKLLLWFGIWRLGAAVCPFNIEVKQEALADLVQILNPVLVVYHKDVDVDTLLRLHSAPRIRFGMWSAGGTDDPQDELFSNLSKNRTAAAPAERNAPEDIAYIFLTSGTTNRPKMVVYDHCACWLNGLSTLEFLDLTENDRTLEYRSFGWGSALVLSLMPFLQRGLTLHIAKRFSHSRRFFEWIQQYGITFAPSVPTVLNILLQKPLGHSAKDLPTLRLMSCSTAPLTAQQWLLFEEMYGIKLLQFYGMSEAGWVCGNRTYKNRIGTVGVPALHQEFAIVDSDGKPCPPGVEGEVTTGGPQAAIGCLRDDGTIERRPNRIKTGDLAIEDQDGFIRVTGRVKDLIIRGGVNIAPLQIDEVLLKHPGILEAAAVGVPDQIYGEELVCYAVAKPNVCLTETSVRRHCEALLSKPKMPKQIFIVTELPKSERGKVLRDRLREDWIARTRPPADSAAKPPANPETTSSTIVR